MYYSSISNYLKNLETVPSGMTTNKCIHTCSSQGKKKWAYLKIDERWMLQLIADQQDQNAHFPSASLASMKTQRAQELPLRHNSGITLLKKAVLSKICLHIK